MHSMVGKLERPTLGDWVRHGDAEDPCGARGGDAAGRIFISALILGEIS